MQTFLFCQVHQINIVASYIDFSHQLNLPRKVEKLVLVLNNKV